MSFISWHVSLLIEPNGFGPSLLLKLGLGSVSSFQGSAGLGLSRILNVSLREDFLIKIGLAKVDLLAALLPSPEVTDHFSGLSLTTVVL